MIQNYQADNDSITGLLRTITQAQSYFITDTDPRILFDELLSNLLILTNSEYGFIGEIRYQPDNVPYLKTHAITNIAWNEETRKFYDENVATGLEFHNLNTLFGKVITTGEPVISNAPYHDPRRGGLPEGHPPLNAFLGLPFYQGNRLIGMVGIANRPKGYDEDSINYLQPFLAICANIIEAYRINKQNQQSENALRDSESKNRAILETMIGGIVVIDSNGIIELFNPAAEKMFGYLAPEVIGYNVNRLMPEPYHSEHDQYLNNYLTTSQRKIIGIGREVVAKRKDGSFFPIELAVSEMYEGNALKFVGRIIDITERKAAEFALIKAKEQAEESNRLKSEFLNVISHELRTPLTIMLGNLPLLTDPNDLPDTEEIADIATDIEDSGQHLLTLINDLLDLSKIEAGKMTIQQELLSVAALTQDVITSIQVMAHEKNLTIETEIDDIEVFADPIRLKQILLNLLGNAIKFTENGFIKVKIKTMEHQVCFFVEDCGCGIDEKDVPFIFDAFRQSDSSAARRADGTGLGLAITKKLVELHNGKISVQSLLGKGSVFSFSIPKNSVVKLKKKRLSNTMSKILVVDDNLNTRKMLCRHLTKSGYEVSETDRGKIALEKIKEELPEVILLDVMMPDMTGFEVCQQLRKTPQYELIYIIMLTALTDSKYKIEGLDKGADDYVTKPFDISELLARIRVGERTAIKKREATIDGLTKVYNRNYFDMYLAQEVSRAKRYKRELSLIITDIDLFKNINDTYGHLTGDTVLQEFTQIIMQQCRRSDLVARFGGEEFIILLPETPLKGGTIVAERMCERIDAHIFQEVKHITASFGVASLITDRDGRELLRRADSALYKAKKNGRNQVVVDIKMKNEKNQG